jgi:hypothetical protein
MSKPLFIFLVVFSLIHPFSSSLAAQGPSPMPIGPPETLEELKSVLSRGWGAFPAAFKSALNEALAFWGRLLDWVGLNTNLDSEAATWWQRIQNWCRERVEIFKTEFQKEKQEMLQDIQKIIPQLLKDLWQRIHG